MMKITEAMRLGTMMTAQAFDMYCDNVLSPTATCAFGAALYAVGAFPETLPLDWLAPFDWAPSEWDWINHAYMKCPVCHREELLSVCSAFMHLNDFHRWTREAIVAWLEPIEAMLAPQPIPVLVQTQSEKSLLAEPLPV